MYGKNKMLYWLIYDISSNKLRNKISSLCKNYGLFRIQKSSFIGEMSKNKIEMLMLEIKSLNLGVNDCIFIIPACKSCFSEKEVIGEFNDERLKKKGYLIF